MIKMKRENQLLDKDMKQLGTGVKTHPHNGGDETGDIMIEELHVIEGFMLPELLEILGRQ